MIKLKLPTKLYFEYLARWSRRNVKGGQISFLLSYVAYRTLKAYPHAEHTFLSSLCGRSNGSHQTDGPMGPTSDQKQARGLT